MLHFTPFCIKFNVLSKYNANRTKLLDEAIHIKVLHAALLGADKMVPVLDEALISASKVFLFTAIIVRNQIYAGKYVAKLISSLGMQTNYCQYWMQKNSLHPK